MKLTFDRSQCFAVPDALLSILNSTLAEITPPETDSDTIILNFRDSDYSAEITPPETDSDTIILNFRDSDYSADGGGFHPVEIRLVRHHDLWQFAYITDFSFQGSPYPELVVDIDVCFISKEVYSIYGGWLDKTSGEELKELFLANFISYVEMEVFKVEVTFH